MTESCHGVAGRFGQVVDRRNVLQPFALDGPLSALAEGLDVTTWDGAGEPPAEVLERTDFYVMPPSCATGSRCATRGVFTTRARPSSL
jgi:hypothetical protein